MARRSLIGFIVLNIVVTFTVTTAIILINERTRSNQAAKSPVPPLIVVITATPDPNQAPFGAQSTAIFVTATPPGGPNPGTTPDSALTAAGALATLPTIDPSRLPDSTQVAASLETLNAQTVQPTHPSGCPTYTIKSGDVIVNIARTFGVAFTDLMRANKLTERDTTRLQPGQVIIIPVGGCGLFPTETPTWTPTVRQVTLTPPPSVTPIATASEARLEIVQILSPGDITAEGVVIRNISGDVIDMGGWTLTDRKGATYTFPTFLMVDGWRVTLFTRSGNNTPYVLFWGRTRALWGEPDQEFTISDSKGKVQLKYSLAQGATAAAGAAGTPVTMPTP